MFHGLALKNCSLCGQTGVQVMESSSCFIGKIKEELLCGFDWFQRART